MKYNSIITALDQETQKKIMTYNVDQWRQELTKITNPVKKFDMYLIACLSTDPKVKKYLSENPPTISPDVNIYRSIRLALKQNNYTFLEIILPQIQLDATILKKIIDKFVTKDSMVQVGENMLQLTEDFFRNNAFNYLTEYVSKQGNAFFNEAFSRLDRNFVKEACSSNAVFCGFYPPILGDYLQEKSNQVKVGLIIDILNDKQVNYDQIKKIMSSMSGGILIARLIDKHLNNNDVDIDKKIKIWVTNKAARIKAIKDDFLTQNSDEIDKAFDDLKILAKIYKDFTTKGNIYYELMLSPSTFYYKRNINDYREALDEMRKHGIKIIDFILDHPHTDLKQQCEVVEWAVKQELFNQTLSHELISVSLTETSIVKELNNKYEDYKKRIVNPIDYEMQSIDSTTTKKL